MQITPLRAPVRLDQSPAEPAAGVDADLSLQRLPALDIVRTLAIAGVIGVHVAAWAGRDAPQAAHWQAELDTATRLVVPSFVLLTGTLLAQSARRDTWSVGDFFRKRLARVGLPWLVWAAVWLAVWELAAPLATGDGLPTPEDFVISVLSGPGYLYFLLLVLQLSLLFPLFATSAIASSWVAGAGVMLQLAFNFGRLWLPADVPDAVWWLIVDHGYELAPGWLGFFTIGIFLGSDARLLLRPTLLRVLLTVGVACVSVLALATPEAGAWASDRLTGANRFLHPLFLPAGVSVFLLAYWVADALVAALPRLGSWAASWGAWSFGVYLVHQYPLDVLGRLQQINRALPQVSEPLPGSLPEVLLLYAVTCLAAVGIIKLLRAHPWGLLALGERPDSRTPPDRAEAALSQHGA